MKSNYSDFEKTILDKLERDGGKSQLTMINGGIGGTEDEDCAITEHVVSVFDKLTKS